MTDIEIPYNKEAEEALIGSVLLNPTSIYELPTAPGEFYLHRHQYIWKAYRQLQDRLVAIDYVTVTEELERMGKLSDIGGVSYLTKLLNYVPSSLHALEYAKSVRDAFIRRDTLEYARKLTSAAYNENTNIITSRSDIAQGLTNVQGTSGAVHISVWMDKLYDKIGEWADNPSITSGLPTGYADLDEVMGDGLMTGVVLLGGKPGQGKSILAQNIAENMIDVGIPGVLYSAEMTWLDMSLRILSKRTGVRVSEYRKGQVPDDKWSVVTREIEKINALPFYVFDPKGMKAAELRADLTRLKAQHGIKWAIFDYMELLGDEYAGLKDWERSAKLARQLVLMMTPLDIASLVVQKLNKNGWEGMPELSDFAGGSDVGYDVVNALVLCEHIPADGSFSDGNTRTVISVKPQRLVEQTRKACNLYKHDDIPLFSSAMTTKSDPNQAYRARMNEVVV